MTDDTEKEASDLYGDLIDAKRAPATATVAVKRSSQTTADNEQLQKELDGVREENERLKRNMGIMFRTARAEIQRKDAKIENLMEQLDKRNAHSET